MRDTWLRVLLIAVGAMLALCALLSAGVFVARLGYPELGRPPGLFRPLFGSNPRHGAVGTIQSIDARSQTLTLRLRDGTTQVVLVNNQSRIEKGSRKIAFSDLQVGDRIAAIGSPDGQGRIIAKWVHVSNSSGSAAGQGSPGPVGA
ncbi:MAG: DUF5666 domain-containing protein [Chloroflexi bacterium]|nr:DUF5666 domain-containing protein [Chloroflexota bacterium]